MHSSRLREQLRDRICGGFPGYSLKAYYFLSTQDNIEWFKLITNAAFRTLLELTVELRTFQKLSMKYLSGLATLLYQTSKNEEVHTVFRESTELCRDETR